MIFKSKEILLDDKYEYLLCEFVLYFSSKGYLQFTVSRINGDLKGKLLHRVIYDLEYGNLGKRSNVHHINGNILDNRVDNFQCFSRGEHTKLHNYGNKNWLGKKHTEETKEKIRNYNLGRVLSLETRQKISNARRRVCA